MTIVNQNTTNTAEKGGPLCCLGNTAITDTGKELYRWFIRIQAMKYATVVGICQIKQVQRHKFKTWGWYEIGHGHYCVRSDGTAISHSDNCINYEQKAFSFRTGDVLQF